MIDFTLLQVIEKYTNITFTDKQKEDPAKLYDLITSSGLWNIILNNLNIDDYNSLLTYCDKAIKAYYEYHNSIFGILDTIGKDYDNASMEAQNIYKYLNDPENMSVLKDVLTKLG